MPTRKPNETIEQFAIRAAYETGHFWSPANAAGLAVRPEDLKTLTASDPVVVAALQSYAMSDATKYTALTLKHHRRRPMFDGEIGPAITELVETSNERCPVPDYLPPIGVDFQFDDPDLQAVVERMQADTIMPAQGSGNWSGCHGVGSFHCAVARWDLTRKPGHLPDDLFRTVLSDTQAAYAGVGLLWRFVDAQMRDLITGEDLDGLNVNTDCSFVPRSDGWIGLAIVGRNETCSSRIWARFLATYPGGQNQQDIRANWGTLVRHELGHNCGRGHSPGIMSPSLTRNLPATWEGDSSESWMRQQFGGEPVPIPGEPVPPEPGPSPPDDIERRLRQIEIKNAVQDVTIDWLVRQV